MAITISYKTIDGVKVRVEKDDSETVNRFIEADKVQRRMGVRLADAGNSKAKAKKSNPWTACYAGTKAKSQSQFLRSLRATEARKLRAEEARKNPALRKKKKVAPTE